MDCISLKIRGEQWVVYPKGLKFPKAFARLYPFRGRGFVSAALWLLNRIGADSVILPRRPNALLFDDVACFWPSRRRSTGRYYGYRVRNGVIVEYLKFGVTDAECVMLRREAENVSRILAIAPRSFVVPKCVGLEEKSGTLIVRYEPLPESAVDVPLSEGWRSKIRWAQKEIAAAGYQHGDFGRHNCKACGNDLWILDWEELSSTLPSLLDEVSFGVMEDYYIWGKTIDAISSELMNRYSGRKSELFCAVCSMRDRRIALGEELLLALERRCEHADP